MNPPLILYLMFSVSLHQPGIETSFGPENLEGFVKKTDILVCFLPLTKETINIINHKKEPADKKQQP